MVCREDGEYLEVVPRVLALSTALLSSPRYTGVTSW